MIWQLRNVSRKLESDLLATKKRCAELVEQCNALKKGREESVSLIVYHWALIFFVVVMTFSALFHLYLEGWKRGGFRWAKICWAEAQRTEGQLNLIGHCAFLKFDIFIWMWLHYLIVLYNRKNWHNMLITILQLSKQWVWSAKSSYLIYYCVVKKGKPLDLSVLPLDFSDFSASWVTCKNIWLFQCGIVDCGRKSYWSCIFSCQQMDRWKSFTCFIFLLVTKIRILKEINFVFQY